jgi:hypothetical protein
LVVSHRNERDIVLIVGAKPFGRIDLRRRLPVTNNVFKLQTITADIGKPLPTRNDSNAIAAVLQSGCIERPDDACAIYQYLHRCLPASERLTTDWRVRRA